MPLGNLPAGQSDPYRTVQPAGPFGQRSEEWLAQQEALAGRGYRPKPQFASLISTVQDNPPRKSRPLPTVPVEHSDELFA